MRDKAKRNTCPMKARDLAAQKLTKLVAAGIVLLFFGCGSLSTVVPPSLPSFLESVGMTLQAVSGALQGDPSALLTVAKQKLDQGDLDGCCNELRAWLVKYAEKLPATAERVRHVLALVETELV